MTSTVVALGEALWDVFPDRRCPGGAPCNVAYHAAQLGNRAAIVTRVGRDALGDELVRFLDERGVETGWVQRDDAHPTGTVSVSLRAGQPHFTITDDVAWDYLAPDGNARDLVRNAAAVCVGSLAQRSVTSRATIRDLLSVAAGAALVVFDVNLRPPFVDRDAIAATLPVADVVKLGEDEVDQLGALFGWSSPVNWLVEDLGVGMVCVTRGERGASLTTRQETISVPGVSVDTSSGDAVGAGDAFTAALTHQLVRGAPVGAALHAANRYAALVASRPGAMPSIPPPEIRRSVTEGA